MNMMDAIEIIEERDDATIQEYIDAFAYLIESKVVWGLQGFYGRTARHLIDCGAISEEGKVLSYHI